MNNSVNELISWREIAQVVLPAMLKEKRKNRKSCNNKEMYESLSEAKSGEISYRSEIGFSTMDVYYCPIHSLFHKGHSDRMQPEEICRREETVNNSVIQHIVDLKDQSNKLKKEQTYNAN